MTIWKPLTRPPLRTIALLFAVLGLISLTYLIYPTGRIIRDGRHDLGTNGIWLQHGWLGHDDWFLENNRDPTLFRNEAALRELASLMKKQRMRYLFPHLCPCRPDGTIAMVDQKQTELFLDHFTDFEVIPWIGGIFQNQCSPESLGWRKNFVNSTLALLKNHPRLAGVQINIEPMPSGNEDFLLLLEELKVALPAGKILSVAAYPPPTRWHPFPDVHWEEEYFRQVAQRCDLIAPMMYDTTIRFPKLYQQLMKSWTREVLAWSGDTPVLLGLPPTMTPIPDTTIPTSKTSNTPSRESTPASPALINSPKTTEESPSTANGKSTNKNVFFSPANSFTQSAATVESDFIHKIPAQKRPSRHYQNCSTYRLVDHAVEHGAGRAAGFTPAAVARARRITKAS